MFSVPILTAALLLPPVAAGMERQFETTEKDFGSVPHGSISSFDFVMKNNSDSRVRVSGVRSSCKCAEPEALTSTADPGDDLVVRVKYNATTFTGPRSMSIYVTFSEPVHETVTLRVKGYSRSDVTITPGSIDFGVVSQGNGATKKATIDYTGGDSNWQIEEILPASHVTVTSRELDRQLGRIRYEVTATLGKNAPAGTLSEIVQIRTNDPKSSLVQLHVDGIVKAPLMASPSELDIPKIVVGQKVKRKVLLRGDKPFTIKWVDGDIEGMNVMCTEGQRKVHILQVEFEPKAEGKFDRTLEVMTDLNSENALPYRIVANVEK
ncbi:hypothetical protein Pan216_36010 [Planctomycetes bacterium Pan216]|uniref:DUF1573 domain-containing protein n=2 Tax=Kolteria novifilia TaxID=2527975 RepID=A0A518B700_9BACT|nr:hypothetical protein Pan216_36010 [Planctomycetes bacterium Pan216]